MNKWALYSMIFAILIIPGALASDYVFKETSIAYNYNPLQTGNNGVAMMFPLLMLAICLISVMIDFASIGVIIGTTLTLVIGYLIGLLPISLTMVITFAVMAILFIWKMMA